MYKEKVIYKNEGKTEEITIENIELRKDYEIIKNNIFCDYPNCNCKMLYVPKGKHRAHFKTWRGFNHIEECTEYFERTQERQPTRSTAENATRLSSKHKNRILREMVKAKAETQEQKEQKKKKARDRYRKKKSQTVDAGQISNEANAIRPVTGKDGEVLVEGMKNPRVSRRFSIVTITEADLNTAIGLSDEISSITVDDNFVVITLTDITHSKFFNIHFEQDFFAEAPSNIDSWFQVLKSEIKSGKSISLECVGNIEKRKQELVMTVHEEEDIRVNGLKLLQFVMNCQDR